MLDKIAEEIRNCNKCALSRSRTNAVPGEGSSFAKIAVLGEAPGAVEDRMGRPFVGQSGMLLRRTLKSVGIDATDVFITNINKCRPPQNRAPTKQEVEACRPYLQRQLKIISPKVIVLLGNTALKAMLNLTGITSLRGKVIERGGVKYLPIFHPAAVLRDMRRLDTFKQDLLLAKSLSQESADF